MTPRQGSWPVPDHTSDDTRRQLLDLAVGLHDTCDDMADLLPPTPHSMSSDQLVISRLVDSMRQTTHALLVVLR